MMKMRKKLPCVTRCRRPAAPVLTATLAAALAATAGAGCGNYSNADLEFMSAIPQTQDVTVEPPRTSALSTGMEADGLRTTVAVTTQLNAVAAGFLSLIDKIRSYYPTTRQDDTRVWGPFPAEQNPGWQIEFEMTKQGTVAAPAFDYVLVMIPPPGVTLSMGGSSTQILGGSFAASGTAAQGVGHLVVSPDEAMQAGASLPGLEKLVSLTIDYDTEDWPRTLTMAVVNMPPADPTMDAQSASYTYQRAQNGDGAMTFTLLQDIVPGPAGVDTLSVTSRWLGTGAGRSDIAVIAGDGAGQAMSTECWDATSASTYKLQSWAPPATGDPSTCISAL